MWERDGSVALKILRSLGNRGILNKAPCKARLLRWIRGPGF